MFYMPKTSLFDAEEGVLSKNAAITAEGQALVATADGLKPSEGTEGEMFAGFACQRVSATPFLEDYYVRVEELTVATAGSLVLQREPLSNEVVGLFDLDKGAAVEGETTVSGKTISNANLTEGMNVRVTYRYAMSVVEAKSIMGDLQPGGPSGAMVGQIGFISRGVVFTNWFDPAVDWTKATAIKLAANGMITDQSGEGEAIKGYVLADGIPSAMYPFLGIKFSAA
nr:MAG TPA: hypothetical protein [Caudoviricetes sp.]